MNITELTREELETVKQRYYMDKEAEAGRGVSFGELADINSLVSDEEIIAACGHIDFTKGDFEA